MLLTANQLAEFTCVRDALMADCDSADQSASSWLDPEHVEAFVEHNPAGLSPADLERARSWRTAVTGPFFVMRHTGSCTIFMNELGTFAVRGTDRELAELVPKTPTMVETTLVPFDGLIVCAEDPRFDPAEAGEADRAAIDATYRGLSDKGVIYSTAMMARVLRGATSGMARRSDAAVPMTPEANAKVSRDEPTVVRPAVSPTIADTDERVVRAAASHARVAPDGVTIKMSALMRENSSVVEPTVDELAPVEMLHPAERRRPMANVPSGLAQIIAFKPRASARAALS